MTTATKAKKHSRARVKAIERHAAELAAKRLHTGGKVTIGADGTATAPADEADEYRPCLPLALVRPSTLNPRKTFDEEKLAELADSIRQVGIIEPIVVRPAPVNVQQGPLKGRHEAYELVVGERRVRAAQIAGCKAIPARVRAMTDKQVLETQLIENLLREDVHPIEEAAGFRRLLDEHGYDADALAAKLGKSPTYVYGTLKLLNLPGEAQQAYRQGKLSRNHCILIGRIPNERLRQKATEAILRPTKWEYVHHRRGERLSFRDAQALVQEEFCRELKGAPFDLKDAKLLPEAGDCDACPKRTGNDRKHFPEGRADVCTDPECFGKKAAAVVKLGTEKLKARGLEVLPRGEAKKALRPSWQHNSAFVELKEKCYQDPKRRSYKELVGEAVGDQVKVAVDDKGKPHYVARRAAVEKALESEGIKARGGGGRQYDWQAEERKRHARDNAIRQQFVARIYHKLDGIAGKPHKEAAFFKSSLRLLFDEWLNQGKGQFGFGQTMLVGLARAYGALGPLEEDAEQAAAGLLEAAPDELAVLYLAALEADRINNFFDLKDSRLKKLSGRFGINLREVGAEAKKAVKAGAAALGRGADLDGDEDEGADA